MLKHLPLPIFKKEWAYVICGCLIVSGPAFAQQNIPGPADVSRIIPDTRSTIAPAPDQRVATPSSAQQTPLPPEAAQIKLTLRDIHIEGATAFSKTELSQMYAAYIGKEITLDVMWKISEDITAFYREHGYFLSRAYIPQQEIDTGIVKINVVEGYIGEVVLDDPLIDKRLVRQLTQEMTAQRPIKAEKLEEIVLRLNDLPGHNFRSVLKPLKDGAEGATQLVLLPSKDKGRGAISFGNSGSRFLGPFIGSVTYQDSFIDMQQTTLSLAASTQVDELKYAMLTHEIPLTPKLSLNLSGNYIQATPGYTLRQNDIQSFSTELETGLTYHYIRQWQKNLNLGVAFNGRNTNSNILDTPLTRDRIRTLRGSVDYDFVDAHNAYHSTGATISQGLSVLSSSKENDLNLSRGEATPDFTKIEANYKQQRYLGTKFIATGKVAGQLASDPLFSSEEFGYGGVSFGRAYDNSEITGDNGLAGSVEIGYKGLPSLPRLNVTPFVFYDIGKVWNLDQGSKPQSGTSAGVGVHTIVNNGIFLDLSVAQPLTREIETPLYGNGKNPRLLLQINSTF